MDRAALLRGLRRERDQRLYCWQIPFAVLSYAVACTSLILHLQVYNTFTLESGIVNSIVATTNGAMSVVSMATFYDYLRQELVPAAFPRNLEGTPGTLNTYSQILGGIRLSQGRSLVASCPYQFAANLVAVSHGVRCHPSSSSSRGSFGDWDVAEAYNVSSAFSPSASSDAAEPFQLILSSSSQLGDVERLIDGLQAAHWIDSSTKHVGIEIAVLNLEVTSWSRLLLAFEFTRGGRVDTTWSVRSVPLDPYLSSPVTLVVFDVLNLFYFVYLIIVLAFVTWRKLHDTRHLVHLGKGLVNSIFASFDAWWVVDVACAVSLLAAFCLWGATVQSLKALEMQISQSLWTDVTAAFDTMTAQGFLEASLDLYRQFKLAGFVVIILLTIRLFWQFSLQPRLAVITECLSRTAVDMAHL
jgi:hypothetical protein